MSLPKDAYNLIAQFMTNALKSSSDALSALLDQEVSATTSKTEVLSPWAIGEHYTPVDKVYTVTAIKTLGDVNGFLLLLFEESQAILLANQLISNYETNIAEELSPLGISALKEVTNIISGTLLTQISTVSSIDAPATVPDMATDMLKALLDEFSAELATTGNKTLAVSSDFVIYPLGVTATLIFVMSEEAIKKILDKVR